MEDRDQQSVGDEQLPQATPTRSTRPSLAELVAGFWAAWLRFRQRVEWEVLSQLEATAWEPMCSELLDDSAAEAEETFVPVASLRKGDDLLLVVRNSVYSDVGALTHTELLDQFGHEHPTVLVVPDRSEVTVTTRAIYAQKLGVDLEALAEAREAWQELQARPSEGAFNRIGDALQRVWS